MVADRIGTEGGIAERRDAFVREVMSNMEWYLGAEGHRSLDDKGADVEHVAGGLVGRILELAKENGLDPVYVVGFAMRYVISSQGFPPEWERYRTVAFDFGK